MGVSSRVYFVVCLRFVQAAVAVGVTNPHVNIVESEVLPLGCYYKRSLPTYYHNFYNHTNEQVCRIPCLNFACTRRFHIEHRKQV